MRNAKCQGRVRARDPCQSISHSEFRISHSDCPMSTLLASLAGLPNAAEPVPGWITGGQPTEPQLKAFKAAGGEVVLDNRDPMEPRPFDEPATVRVDGVVYISCPIVHGAVTAEALLQRHRQLPKRIEKLCCS